jgi:hypothetical protein
MHARLVGSGTAAGAIPAHEREYPAFAAASCYGFVIGLYP